MITAQEFLEVQSMLAEVVENELGCAIPYPQEFTEISSKPSQFRLAPDPALRWLALLDLAVSPPLLRKHVKERGPAEETIRAYLRFLVSKKHHTQADRDKVDWLATHLFQAREERTKQPTGWPKAPVEEILKGFQPPPLRESSTQLLDDLSSLLEEIRHFETFGQITDSRIIDRGRDLKNRFEDDFFHPDVLAATINYNLIFGKKFHALLQQTIHKVKDIAARQPDERAPNHQELLTHDYRSTAGLFRDLSELGRKQETEKPKPPFILSEARPENAPASPAPFAGSSVSPPQLRDLGINVEAEALKIRKRKEELSVRLRANPSVTSLPGTWSTLPLLEWESGALRAEYPLSEQSFRAEFARNVSQAMAILSLIDDELPQYQEKRGTEYLWKRHYDTLLYLLQEGRCHKDRLLRLAVVTEQKGLIEKAKQLAQTAEKLESGLNRVAAIF